MALAIRTGTPLSEWAANPRAAWTAARLLGFVKERQNNEQIAEAFGLTMREEEP